MEEKLLDNTLTIKVTFNLNVSNDMAIERWVWSFFPLEDVNLCLFGSEPCLWNSGLKCCMNLRRVTPFRTSYGSLSLIWRKSAVFQELCFKSINIFLVIVNFLFSCGHCVVRTFCLFSFCWFVLFLAVEGDMENCKWVFDIFCILNPKHLAS